MNEQSLLGTLSLFRRPRRFYMAGMARFLTAVRESEWLDGERPYAHAMNNPLTNTDPSGLAPCYNPPHPCATFPGGPCAYAKSIGDDKMVGGGLAGGGVVCCDGKAYPCVWHMGTTPGFYKCAFRHEQRHVQDTGGCPNTGYARQLRVGPNSECNPTLNEINCLVGSRAYNCGSNPGCLKAYHDRICDLCKYLDSQSCPKPRRCSNC